MASSRTASNTLTKLGSDEVLRRLRLGSGLVLMVFVALHLANIALGLVSLEAVEAARRPFLAFWRSPFGTMLLYGAMLVHLILTLRALYMRRTLAMPAREAMQIALGLAIPLVIAEHVIGTRLVREMTGINDTYELVLRAIWIVSPADGMTQMLAVLIVWAHGCIGMHFWLRFRPWYPAAAPYLLIAAVLVPVLALLGFSEAGRTVAELDRSPVPPGTDPALLVEGAAIKEYYMAIAYAVSGALLAAVMVLREIRRQREWRNTVAIRYEGGQTVRIPKGHSVLEASRVGGIPHYAVCGGKGRCSTCRVRVIEGLDDQPAPGPIERATLKRIAAAPDVRLACQLKPTHDLKVAQLLVAGSERALHLVGAPSKPGREQEIAVLFCDIRSFTALSDRRLPFDVVFLLNRYFALVGGAVERSGGRLDKFIGDGAMALFGLETGREEACRQALAASAEILQGLSRLSAELAGEIPGPLHVAIGIHAGPAIVGAMGYGGVMNVTAIGDTVNIASRLESAAKEFDASLVVSEVAVALSGVDLAAFEHREIAIRGSTRPLGVRVVPHGAALVVTAAAAAA